MLRFSRFTKTLGRLAVVSFLLSGCSSISAVLKAPTPIPYATTVPTDFPSKSTITVERGDVTRTETYPGRLVSKVERKLQFKIAGRVEQVPVQLGDTVVKDEILAQLQAPVSEYEIKKAEIALEKAKLVYQQTELNTSQFLLDYEIILGLKKVDIDLAQNELDALNRKMEAANLIAPAAGVITDLRISEGDMVDPFNTVMLLADPKQLEISAALPSGDLINLMPNMPVTYYLINDPSIQYSGIVRQLPLTPTDLTNSETVSDNSLRISLERNTPTTGFVVGAPIKVQIEIEKHIGVLWLPPSAVNKVGYNQFVYIENEGKQVQVEVKVGFSTTERVEITDGLSEGQIVLLP